MAAAKLTTSSPIATATVTEIIEENRYAVFYQHVNDDHVDAFEKKDPNWRNTFLLNTPEDTTNSIATISSTSFKTDTTLDSSSKDVTPTIQNNNEKNDVSSTQSVSDEDQLIDLDWIDELVLEHQANEIRRKSNKQNKKKLHLTVKDLNQLDGVPSKNNLTRVDKQKTHNASEAPEDEKILNCLYFTLMCCDCSIS